MGNLGATEIILIAFVVLLLFGGKKIPELMRGLGKGVREFKDAKDNVRRELEESINEKETKQKLSQTPSHLTNRSLLLIL
jgi:sec-independent protein translocase protein TatA